MKKALSRIFSIGLLLLLTAASPFAQSVKTVSAPVTIAVDKEVVTPGGVVRISGTSVQLGDKNAVSIDIAKPDKATVSLDGKLTSQGTYNVGFSETKLTGAYTVTAKAPDGKSTAKASFRVVGAVTIGETAKALNQSLSQLAGKSGKIAQAVKAAVDANGDFPGSEQIDRDIAQIDQAFSQLPKRMAGMNKALDQLSGLVKQYPGIANVSELAEVSLALAEVRDEAAGMSAQADDLLSRVSKSSEMSICDRMDAGAEALKFTGLVFDFFGSGTVKLLDLLVNIGAPAAAERIYDAITPVENRTSLAKTAFTDTVKGTVTLFKDGLDELKDFVKGPFGLAYDGAQYLLGLGFDQLCERFIGPIEGVLSVDATDSGRPFWGYKTYIKGRLNLRFEKKQNTGRAPARLTGEFEGAATKFDVYEDLFTSNQTNKKSVLFHKVVPPVAAGDTISWLSLDVLGQMTSLLALPHYFKVPVTGALAADGNSVAIEVADAGIKDFSKDLSAAAYYVSMPLGSIIPIVQKFDIPMQTAQFILSRGLRSPATVNVKTDKLPKGSLLKTIDKTFTREEVVSNGEVTVKWNLKVKACNPECP